MCSVLVRFVFQAEDVIRELVRSGGLGDVYKRQGFHFASAKAQAGRGEGADQVIAFEVGVSPQCGCEAPAPAVDQAIALGDRCEWYRQMFGECSDVVNGLRPLNLAEVSVCGAPAVHWVVDAVEPGCRGECGRR